MRLLLLPTAALLALAHCGPGSTPPDASLPDAAPPADASAADAPVADTPAADAPTLPPPTGDPRSWDARRAGPFNVGYRTLRHAYTPRGASAPRALTLHLWYPTLATTGPHPRYAGLVLDRDAITDAPLAASPYGATYPVHAYSHGDRAFGGSTHFLMRYFASHGWVVIAPDHLGNTLSDTPMVRPLNIYYLRPLDMSAALDALEQLPAGADPLAGRADTRRAVLSGHSFGVHTVWAAAGATFDADAIAARCMPAGACTTQDLEVLRAGTRDPRFVAAVPMAGAINREWFGAEGHRAVTIPLFAMSGSADPVGADAQFSSTAPMPLTWIDVRGACHQFFALGGCMDIPDAEQPAIVGAYALAFARRHVLDDTAPATTDVLEGRAPLSPLVTLQRR